VRFSSKVNKFNATRRILGNYKNAHEKRLLDKFFFQVRKHSILVFLRKMSSPKPHTRIMDYLDTLPTGQILLNVPRIGTFNSDVERAMQIISTVIAYKFDVDKKGKPRHCIIEAILSGVTGYNKFQISAYIPYMVRIPKASAYFKIVPPNEAIRQLCLSVCPKGYERSIEGAYLSATPTIPGLIKLAAKVGIDNQTWPIQPKLLYTCLSRFLIDLDEVMPIPDFTFPYEYVDNLPYNSDSNTGFPVFAFDEKLKKRDIQPYVIAYCKQLFKEVQRGTSAWDWVVTLVTRFFAKNEVRGPDDPIDKVRIIGTNGPLGDAFSRLVSMGALDRWSKFLPCFIGVSVWSTMVYTMLLAMEHRYFMKIDKRMRTKDIMVRHAHDTCYILLDLSSQDFTFNPLLLFITLWLRIFSYDFSKSPGMDRDMFINIFVLEMGYANCKVVHWLDDMFYIFLGMMCSGYLMTSHGDTIFDICYQMCFYDPFIGSRYP